MAANYRRWMALTNIGNWLFNSAQLRPARRNDGRINLPRAFPKWTLDLLFNIAVYRTNAIEHFTILPVILAFHGATTGECVHLRTRFCISFFTAKNETEANIHRNLESVYGEECMNIQMVRRWRSWFLEGRQNVHDDERSGRPVTATDNAAVAAVRNVVGADRRVTIDEIMIRLPPGI
ncbi:hypothetical protein LAZ67_23000160 [Cordylochernes scorpioides]|uniref:Mos1 transposase HTH domain-containing protein n=1 Tax=Cordylochernes scorpioides TaxID=51811 RepID=A0ABY6LQ34_9ARAC|nr:hypothetical protein LAZ67_23000160 [Cordylochernes scorpioides]